MTNLLTIDVLVIGLGPAGSRAATAAAAAGCSVLAIDRKQEAGSPVQCAEFVPAMLAQELDDLDRVTRQRISRMVTSIETKGETHGTDIEPEFPGRIIDRQQFDATLAKIAERSGAKCRFGLQLEEILPNGIAVLSDGSSVQSKLIIGCDGPRSRVGRAVGQTNLELVETRQMTVPLLKPHDATDIFLSDTITGGYAWLFPKGNIANLGIGVTPKAKMQLKPLLEELHQNLVREGRVGSEILTHTGGAIPVGGLLNTFAWLWKTPVLLAGDAAGLTNPVTGAGITSAVISGGLAGQAAADWLRGDEDALNEYTSELRELFGSALNRALQRRKEILEQFTNNNTPSMAELRRSWIAYPEYWAA
ncbi:MAG: NAD(P)/FAD-dependent oxidoreductase [Rhodospirillaceae bacterium]|jgi:geranylgeranyl reductase family protein